MARVELQNVNKYYDKNVHAIKNANLVIEDKEFVVLVGPSGCGKSTLLRMIAGLEEISGGDLVIDGRKVNDVPPKDRDIAMVFQNYALYPHMSVFDNMAFGLKLRKFPKEDIQKRVEDASEILGIREYLQRKPKALSGGQRQRVALGRAIVRKPKVFLFDEPLSNLDAKLRVQMRIEINRLHTRLQSTMIYVTHDQIEAMTMGDKIVVLKDGVIQQVDSPLNLYNQPANLFVAGFIGSPAMNFIRGQLVNSGKMQFQSGKLQITLPEDKAAQLQKHGAQEVILGVRPEHLHDVRNKNGRLISETQETNIDVVEPIGNEIFVYFNAGNENLCMRTSPEQTYTVRENFSFALDLGKLYFFDVNTEARIV
ncbi:MAG: sn-glycerol-3-phosphate ABC transporter ATP-binding protein UgpC [Calditrichia bacterium]|nr:sn-glycerol-3-phosphate ABC transporter ATP-binding protein UgpC [Calditrichota bacterium]MCB0270525.1 sn-glycerol-3-phosphate ABC transporter ATP-binding protein UgpC [Calditrichota bacterium]MCB0286155.1 sn-glycerol-3-phosphate ABC transporter ATP-binding protein UgpC [Calditrichota bacterium]MCB9068549.1 sn-glycerol-3-phosphate ABC transporter ATP-binding protein UgpC [Calditrichia bacterium]